MPNHRRFVLERDLEGIRGDTDTGHICYTGNKCLGDSVFRILSVAVGRRDVVFKKRRRKDYISQKICSSPSSIEIFGEKPRIFFAFDISE